MSPILRDTPSLLVLGITFDLSCCPVHAMPNDRNEQHYSSIQSHKTNKLFEKSNAQGGNKLDDYCYLTSKGG